MLWLMWLVAHCLLTPAHVCTSPDVHRHRDDQLNYKYTCMSYHGYLLLCLCNCGDPASSFCLVPAGPGHPPPTR